MVLSSFWNHPLTGKKKCSEVSRTDCTDHDDCCAVVQCSFCLEFIAYDGTQTDLAEMIGDQWFGSVAGAAFHAYWKRDEYDVCNFIVTLDGEEVYREPCGGGGGISCRDSSDEAEVTIDYDEGTLRWIKVDKLPLPHIADPDAPGCKTWFCGECECTCEELCATLVTSSGTLSGTLSADEYEACPSPEWSGELTGSGYPEAVTVWLERDPYTGGCILVASVGGEEVTVEVSACDSLFAVFEFYDGSTLRVACKECDCEPICDPCPDPEVYPTLTVSVYPIANCSTAAVDVIVIFDDTLQSWAGSGPWAGTGDTINIILSCSGNSFMAQFTVTLSGSPTACVFGATSPSNQDCELLLFDWIFEGSRDGRFCCGGGLIGSDIGMTVIL